MPFHPGDRVRSIREIGLSIPIVIGSVGTVVDSSDSDGLGSILTVTMDAPYEGDDTEVKAFENAWDVVV